MLEKGWIKLHRKLNKWEWKDDPNMVALLVHFLLNATDEPVKWRGVELKPGQFVSGRKELSVNTGISERSIRTCIERLKSTNEITIKSTNKYSVYTLVNWDIYNSKSEEATSKTTSKLTSKRPASDQQPTTIERKQESNKEGGGIFTPPTEEEVKVFFKEKGLKNCPRKFYLKSKSENWKYSNWKERAEYLDEFYPDFERKQGGENVINLTPGMDQVDPLAAIWDIAWQKQMFDNIDTAQESKLQQYEKEHGKLDTNKTSREEFCKKATKTQNKNAS